MAHFHSINWLSLLVAMTLRSSLAIQQRDKPPAGRIHGSHNVSSVTKRHHKRHHTGIHGTEELEKTLNRMKYWSPGTSALPVTDKYLVFSIDEGGLNNIRIGWEYSGVAALETGRTLVLPPPEGIYLLDFSFGQLRPKDEQRDGKTAVEDLIDVEQLKAFVPTLTWSEFSEKMGGMTWSDMLSQSAKAPEKQKCKFDAYRKVDASILYMQGRGDPGSGRREGFDCGQWWLRGGPRDEFRDEFTEKDWSLLTHGFVWSKDAFDIAAEAVNFLGIFQYNALHARYGDFAERQTQQAPADIFTHWDELFKMANKLYIASDDPERIKASSPSGYQVFTFDELFNKDTSPLAETRKKYSIERWFKLTGPVEQLICTYAKAFVGTGRSSFTGHIQRMRLHAQPPVTTFLYHNGLHAPGENAQPIVIPWEDVHRDLDTWKSQTQVIRSEPTRGDMFLSSSL